MGPLAEKPEAACVPEAATSLLPSAEDATEPHQGGLPPKLGASFGLQVAPEFVEV